MHTYSFTYLQHMFQKHEACKHLSYNLRKLATGLKIGLMRMY